MKRSLGLTLVGVLVILLSALFLTLEIFAMIAIYSLPTKTFPPPMAPMPADPRTFAAVGLGFIVVICAFGIVNGIGLIKRWNWCRYVTIIFGFIAAAMSLMGAVFILLLPLPPSPGMNTSSMSGIRLGVAGFYLFWVVLFLFLSLFLLRRKIAEEFQSRESLAVEPKPLAVLTVAGLLTTGLIALPLMFVFKMPMLFFGFLLSPVVGRVVLFVWILASSSVGIALFRRVHSAFWFAVGIYIFGLINGAVMLLPGPRSHFAELMQQYTYPGFSASVTPGVMTVAVMLGLLSAIVPLILLAVGRQRFLEFCERKNGPIAAA